MRAIGMYLIFAVVVLRGIVIFTGDSQFNLVVALLIAYGLFRLVEPWVIQHQALHNSPGVEVGSTLSGGGIPLAYLLLQSCLAIRLLLVPPPKDFFALLFIPLSLQAVLFFGRRTGFMVIAAFSLAMAFPLLASEEGRLFGLAMTLLYSGVCFLFGGYAHQVHKAEWVSSQNQRMLDELLVAHRKLRGYATQVEDLAAEQARYRLARELHDSVTQTMFSMNLSAQSARLLMGKDPSRVSQQLDRLLELCHSAVGEIQVLVSQLRPPAMTEEGLIAALRRLAVERRRRDGLEVNLEIAGERRLPDALAVGIYSIVQEALNNVAKHAGTQQATVRLSLVDTGGCLEIEDHGRGFDLQAALRQGDHLGLAGMGERARELGWNLTIESYPGSGTRVRVEENPPEG